MKRLESIDVLRAVAILLMVQIHFVGYLAPPSSGPAWLRALCEWLGGLSAPTFTFLVGMSLCLSLHKQAAAGRPEGAIARRTVKRGLLVFVLGLFHLLVIWGPDEVFTWDILTLIGFAIVALYPLRKLRPAYLLLLALAVVLVSPWLRQWTYYGRYWDVAWGEYYPPFRFKEIWRGFWVNGYFPVFPWSVFPLVGFATARLMLLRPRPIVLRWLPLAGLGLLGLGVGGAWLYETLQPTGSLVRHIAPATFYPASTTYLLYVLGLILLAFWFLHTRLDLRPAARGWMAFFRRYSRYSLTTYVVHLAVHIWPILILGVAQWDDPWAYYADAVSLPTALGLAVLFIGLFYVALGRWDRAGSKYSLEWVLGRLVAWRPGRQ